jgi:hypothetical protein
MGKRLASITSCKTFGRGPSAAITSSLAWRDCPSSEARVVAKNSGRSIGANGINQLTARLAGARLDIASMAGGLVCTGRKT